MPFVPSSLFKKGVFLTLKRCDSKVFLGDLPQPPIFISTTVIRIIGLQGNDIGKAPKVFPQKSEKQCLKAVSSLNSFTVPFLVDWTPALENS